MVSIFKGDGAHKHRFNEGMKLKFYEVALYTKIAAQGTDQENIPNYSLRIT